MHEHSDNALAPPVGSRTAEPILSDALTRCARKILLVENEEDQLAFYAQELSEEGYQVSLARNGKEALRHLEERPCHLVVLDIVMPEMDGIEALAKIASRYRKMPVILHTAYTHYRDDFMTWLADAFVLKSSDLSVLKSTVKRLLAGKQEEDDYGVLRPKEGECMGPRPGSSEKEHRSDRLPSATGPIILRRGG